MRFSTQIAMVTAIAGTVIFGAPAFAESKPNMVTLKQGDTLSSIADTHKTTYVRIFNANENITNPDQVNAGDEIRIPAADEQLPERFAEYEAAMASMVSATNSYAYAPTSYNYAAPNTATYTPVSYNRSYAYSAPVNASSVNAGNRYSYGNCTWYVYNKRPDVGSFWGNGGQWTASAQASGYSTGSTPQVGAVAEQAGHVAYVEAVNGNQVTVSEMNYAGGYGQVSTRTVPASQFSYIY